MNNSMLIAEQTGSEDGLADRYISPRLALGYRPPPPLLPFYKNNPWSHIEKEAIAGFTSTCIDFIMDHPTTLTTFLL